MNRRAPYFSLNIFLLLTGLAIFLTGCKPGPEKPARPVNLASAEIFCSKLPGILKETSGLVVFKNRIWTINDSGGKNVIYGFDPEREIIDHEIVVKNATNRDWEALAFDGEYIYVGDFGNNRGNRTDLKIYKVEVSDVEVGRTILEAEVISFAWADQDKFVWIPQKHPHDCEAMIAHKDSLYLFTKDWMYGFTKLYGLPKVPGQYLAHPVDSFNVGALVTGATFSPKDSCLVLSSYFQYIPSLWIFWNFDGSNFFGGSSKQVYYPDYHDAQTEGTSFFGTDTILVSAERTKRHPQRIYQFSLSELLEENVD